MLSLLLKFGLSQPVAKLIDVLWPFVLAIACLVGAFFYGEHREAAVWQAKIQDYEQKLTIAQNKNDEQVQKLKTQQQADLLALQTQLDAEKARKQKVLTVVKEVPKYVTAKADSACTLTAGFVWMSNLPLAGQGRSGDQGPTVPAGPPRDVDAPAGVTASTVARVTAENNAECVARGQVIDHWQQWYASAKSQWDKLRASLVDLPGVPQ